MSGREKYLNMKYEAQDINCLRNRKYWGCLRNKALNFYFN